MKIAIVDIENMTMINWDDILENLKDGWHVIIVGHPDTVPKTTKLHCKYMKNANYIESVPGANSADLLICFMIGAMVERYGTSEEIVLITRDKFGKILRNNLKTLGFPIRLIALNENDKRDAIKATLISQLENLQLLSKSN